MSDSFDSLSENEISLESIQYKPPTKEKAKEKTNKKPNEKPIIEKQVAIKKSKPMKAMKVAPTEEELIDKRRVILLLQFYLVEFPDELKSFKKVNMEKKTHAELLDIKTEMDFVLGNNSNIKKAVEMFRLGIQTIEVLALNFTPFNITGLSSVCNDPETIKDIKLIALKHSKFIQTEPEARLAWKLVTTCLILNGINPSIVAQDPNIAQNIPRNEDSIKNVNSRPEYVEI